MISKFKKGFSLVELLVVIAIIGILAAVGITAYSGYTSSAKEKATLANHAQILAVLNAEMAKCAAGAGDFVWGGACNTEANETNIVTHFGAGAGNLSLENPYVRTAMQVSLDPGDESAWDGDDGTPNTVAGRTVVHCNADGCSIATKQNGTDTDTFAAVAAY
jgi:type IV pilus assembly protein PilA